MSQHQTHDNSLVDPKVGSDPPDVEPAKDEPVRVEEPPYSSFTTVQKWCIVVLAALGSICSYVVYYTARLT